MVLKAISTAALPLREWPAPGKWTYQDYLALHDDGNRYEIIWGELYMMTPAPSPQHQRASRNLGYAMWDFVQEHNLGEVLFAPCDLVMEPGATPVQPDILFISSGRLGIITEREVSGVPDLLVEVVSPSDPNYDRVTKFQLYEQSGVLEYWIVDPRTHTIEVFVLEGESYSLRGRYGAGEEATSSILARFGVTVDSVLPMEK